MGNVSPAMPLSSRIVAVKVQEARPSGIRISLEDGRKGFIRAREISWERRISVPIPLPSQGDILQAKILDEKSRGNILFLSTRQLTDPWEDVIVKQKYKFEQIVEGEVVNIRNTGAYIQVEPGIDGVISPRDAPLMRGQTIEDLLWLGDKVSAKIRAINKRDKLLELDLIKRLQYFPSDPGQRKKILIENFGAERHPQKLVLTPKQSSQNLGVPVEEHFIKPIIHKLQRILLTDDEFEWLDLLSAGLKKEFGIDVDIATTGEETLDKVSETNSYSLAIIDLNLKGELGIDVASKLRDANKEIPILLISAFDFDEDGNPLDEYEYPFCQKSLDELIYKINELRHGHWKVRRLQNSPKNGDGNFVHHLGMESFAKRPTEEIFAEILSQVREQTEVTQCLLIELDRTQQTGVIIASQPPLDKKEQNRAQDGLYFSPARQVVEEELEFVDNTVDFEHDPKYKNFLTNLVFESCLGIPIRILDRTTRHALFLLDEEPMKFIGYKENAQPIPYAHTASYLLGVAIERANMLDYMRRYEERYALGHLAMDMIHEINNKMGAFEASVENLKKDYGNFQTSIDVRGSEQLQANVEKRIEAISRIQVEFKELVESYRRQVKNEYEAIDVNSIISSVVLEMRRTAGLKEIEIVLDLTPALPPARVILSQLQQIILNLVLNSIQMINRQHEWSKVYNQQSNRSLGSSMQTGVVIIQTRNAGERAAYPIEVRVIDNGPGIHWRDQERIFAPGFSRRGGSGLGLYISRNLAERMGGRLTIFDSTLYLGSTFLLELSQFTTSEEAI
jgi:signal transduction histidine kinase/predicted RNA-binding protein with RPS1 domain